VYVRYCVIQIYKIYPYEHSILLIISRGLR